MDGVGPRQGSHRSSQQHAGSAHRAKDHESIPVKTRHSGEKYWLVRSLGKVASKRRQTLWNKFKQTEFAQWPDKSKWNRLYASSMAVLILVTTLATTVQPFLEDKFYGVTQATRAILPQPKDSLATYLKFNDKDAKFVYNEGYTGATNSELNKTGQGEPRINASFAKEPSKGVTVTDPLNKTDFKITPKFKLNTGKQDKNQIFYPLVKTAGYLVYTAQTASIKEDIVLEKAGDDQMRFEYQLDIANGLEAKLEKNGSVGVYGTSLPINGNVATGSEKDAELLDKARTNSVKDKLLFVIPAPVIVESTKEKGQSTAGARFEVNGDKLTVIAERLKNASYPLSIDPSVYVQSAAQLMKGNNETNVEFDVATEQFKKGTTTGARIDEWTDTTDMNDAVWDQGIAAAGGYVYRAGGKTSRSMPHIVSVTTTTHATASSSLVVDMPADRPVGDLYILVLGMNFTGTGPVTPCAPGDVPSYCGWTVIKTLNNQMGAFWRYDTTGSYPSTYTFGLSSSQQTTATVLRIKDFNTSSPINTSANTNNGSAPVSYPSVTPNQQGTLVVAGATYTNTPALTHGFSPGTDWADITSIHSTGAAGSSTSGMMISALDVPPTSGAATGSQSLVASGANSNYSSFAAAINGNSVTTSTNTSLQWAHFNSANGTIDSPAPGSNGTACSGWCTNSAYNFPTASPSGIQVPGTTGMSLIAYNGYLYAMGGYDGTYAKSTVYIAKLGANGEPSLWHPSDPDQADWVYWYKDSGLNAATARMYMSAYAYNGKMYVIGGDTNTTANSGSTNSVQIADILPNGTLGSWSAGATMPTAAYGTAVQGYNGYLYLIGGNNNGTLLNTVHYSKLNSDGTMNAWQTAGVTGGTGSTFTTARASQGGLMSGIWGGYIYLAGGCSSIGATDLNKGNCLTIASDIQLASINADGTLDDWNTMLNLRNQRFGYSFIAWQDNLYRIGGCSKQDSSTGDCYSAFKTVEYGNINQDGDASTVSVTSAAGTGNCTGSDPYDCNLPDPGDATGSTPQGGQLLTSTAILNGYLYIIGGCSSLDCNSGSITSGNISYVAISSDGKLKQPPSCPYLTLSNSAWCNDNVNKVGTGGTNGLAAAGVTVFGGRIYVVGGLTGSGLSSVVYSNPVNSDGSLDGAWESQAFNAGGMGLNTYFTSGVAYTFVYSRANPSSAGSNPGNLFIFGGCNNSGGGAGCTTNTGDSALVVKCNITTAALITSCSTSGQTSIPQAGGANAVGLAMHAGAVYANYIYLIGGVAPNNPDLKSVRYAKFDNSNNVVPVSGGTWIESSIEMTNGRRRGAAFGYNGYLYAVGGYEATSTSVLDSIEFVKLNVSDGSLISTNPLDSSKFTQSAVTISQRWGLALAVSNSYAYVIGGCGAGAAPSSCTALDPTIQTFQVYNNDSGAPGGYTTSANLYATDRIGAGAAVLNGYMYIAGGCVSNTDCATTTTSVQRALIDSNGAVGSWSSTTAALPTVSGTSLAYGQLEVAGGGLYYLGGQNAAGTAQSTVYYATLSGNDVTAWNTASGGIGDTSGQAAVARTRFSSAVWGNRIYVTGGYDGSARSTHVYVSPVLTGGGIAADSWTGGSGSAFNVAREGQVAIAYANNVYILGGYDGTNYLNDVQFAHIDSNGTLGSWTYSTSLPTTLRQADGFASNGYMYIFGGRSSTNDCTARTLVAPISANTSIASGNNPTGIGEWYQTNRNFDGGRYGVSAVNYQGKAYVLGGGCQGIVMQDNFDATLDAAEWTSTTGMTAGAVCQSTSTSNVLYTTSGIAANAAITKNVDVSSGGTIFFKFFSQAADGGGCFARESETCLFCAASPDNVVLQWAVSPYSSWNTISTYAYNTDYDPLVRISATIPAGAFSSATRFRWTMLNGEANDSYALEDVYIIANGNTTVSYPADRVAVTSLLSQPQVANYSRLIDAGHDVFPTKWLLNGLDNSIGAHWQMAYRSMNDTTITDTSKACGGSVMTGFGQLTNFGDVTLAQPETYTVKDSSGTDIQCSRYFFMNISIDASQTYGYPDDISRGPTLDNLTLFFKANPGSRLIHGKTFIEGTQQPLDTQPGP